MFSVVDLKKRHREPFLHSPPPVKALKMLSARTGHILHPDYLQPLPSAPVSPIEVTFTLTRTLSEDVNAKQRFSDHFSLRCSLFSSRNTVNTQPCRKYTNIYSRLCLNLLRNMLKRYIFMFLFIIIFICNNNNKCSRLGSPFTQYVIMCLFIIFN